MQLPDTYGRAAHIRALNFPIGATEREAIRSISDNAAAAWRHLRGNITNVKWSSRCLGPKACLMYIPNGPRHFSRLWVRLFVHDVVARSAWFACLPYEVLQLIVTMTR